jgi:uncharacterized protein
MRNFSKESSPRRVAFRATSVLRSFGQPGLPPPPPYKMAILTWIVIFPLISLVVVILGPALKGIAPISRLGITTAITVQLMTWIVMPRVTRLLRRWLYPGATED